MKLRVFFEKFLGSWWQPILLFLGFVFLSIVAPFSWYAVWEFALFISFLLIIIAIVYQLFKVKIVAVLINMFFIVILIWMQIYARNSLNKSSLSQERIVRATKVELAVVANSLEREKKKFGMYPQDLNKIDVGYKYFYYKVASDNQSYDLRDLGIDGQYGTEDDVVFNRLR